MNELIEKFVSHLSAGDVWYGFLMLGVFYVLKKEPFKVFAHFSERKDKTLDQAHSLAGSEKLTSATTELIREYVEKEAFSRYYGISAGPDMREALLHFYKQYQSIIDWHDLRRAFPKIHLERGRLKVNLNWWDWVQRWLVTGLSILTGLYALLILGLGMALKSGDQLQFFLLTVMALVLLVAALLFSSLNWPYHSAKKIARAAGHDVEKLNNSLQPTQQSCAAEA